MKPRSAKGKGNRFEAFLEKFFRLHVDARAHRNPGSGSGLNKGDIVIPDKEILIEAKNQKNISLITWWEQTMEQALGNEIPVLAIRNPRKAEFEDVLIVMGLEDFVELLRDSGEGATVESTLDYSQRSALNSLKASISRVMKEFPHE